MQASDTNGWHACSTGEAGNILTVFDEYRYGYWCEHKRRVAMRVGTESGMREVNPKERSPGRAICSLSRDEKLKSHRKLLRGTYDDVDEQELRAQRCFLKIKGPLGSPLAEDSVSARGSAR